MNVQELRRSFFKSLKPPQKLSLSEWSDQFAVLSAESSAESGRWHTLPYQKGIMDAMTDPAIEQVTVKKSARVGYTKCLNNFIGYHIHQDPCSIMMVQPTVEDAEGYSKEEIAPMLRDTPVLQGVVSDAKAKDGSNTILQKLYPGGTLGIVGANSPRGFRRVSRRIVLLDEVDGYPAGGAGSEGDQVKLAIRRSEYYWNRKIVAGSTPTDKNISRIEKLWEQSDKRRYYVPCPHCGHFDILVFRKPKTKEEKELGGHWMEWPKGEPEKAFYVCSGHGCVIEHKDKRSMVERGEWRATAPSNGKHAGFHIWAGYSFSPNASWGQLATEFLEAKADPLELKTFVNTVLGECWEDEYSAKLSADGIRGRAEFYEPFVVPRKCSIVTAGIDVQDNRFEIVLDAWAPGEESWTLGHVVVFCDPSKPEGYKQLDDILLKPLNREGGGEIELTVAAIDTGGNHTHEVYQYVRERRRTGKIIGVKGQSQRNKPAIGKPTRVDINMKGQVLTGGAEVYPMGSDTIKSVIYGRLKIEEPGAGFIHFHTGLGPEFYEQLTSEKRVTRYVKGFAVHDWTKKSGARNEVLDCKVMSYAALQYLYTRYRRETIFTQFERKLGIVAQREIEPDKATTSDEKAKEPENKRTQDSIRQIQRPRPNIRQRPRGFVKGF